MNKLVYYVLCVFALFLPFHAFLVTFLSSILLHSTSNNLPGLSLLIASWKEIWIVFIGFLVAIKWIKSRRFPIQKFYLFDKIFLVFGIVALFSFVFQSQNIISWIWGFRLDFVYFVLFYLIRCFDFDIRQIKKVFYCLLASWISSMLFGLMLFSFSFDRVPNHIDFLSEKYLKLSQENKDLLAKYYDNAGDVRFSSDELKIFFATPDRINFWNDNFENVMSKFGYSSNISSYNPYKPLPAYHFIEAKMSARYSGTLSGPNQAWFYAMIFIALLLANISSKNQVNKYVFILALLLALLVLYFSFSRSSWIWMTVALGLYGICEYPAKYRKQMLIVSLVLLISTSSLLYVFWKDFVKRTIIREWSSSMHMQKSIEWIKQVISHPLWVGIGNAGPVTIRFSEWDKQNIAECWFIQMFQEFGIHGGLVYLTLMISFLTELYRKRKEHFMILGGFLGLTWLLTGGLFLHSFEDMSVSLLLFLIIGLGFSLKKNLGPFPLSDLDHHSRT